MVIFQNMINIIDFINPYPVSSYIAMRLMQLNLLMGNIYYTSSDEKVYAKWERVIDYDGEFPWIDTETDFNFIVKL